MKNVFAKLEIDRQETLLFLNILEPYRKVFHQIGFNTKFFSTKKYSSVCWHLQLNDYKKIHLFVKKINKTL